MLASGASSELARVGAAGVSAALDTAGVSFVAASSEDKRRQAPNPTRTSARAAIESLVVMFTIRLHLEADEKGEIAKSDADI